MRKSTLLFIAVGLLLLLVGWVGMVRLGAD
jgi:hypothetical protein